MSKVFVIDDSVSACVAIERMLSSQGFDVVWEMDAVTALRTVEKHAPDLVICDLVLPDISGYEVCQSLRSNPLLDNVPVLLISGEVDDEVRRRTRECDAAGIIAKPFTAAQLIGNVQATLGEIERLPADEPPGTTPRALSHHIASELDAFNVLDYQLACVLDGDGSVVAASGRANPGALSPAQKRELSHLGELASLAASGARGEVGKVRLTLETDSGVRLIDDLGAGYLLVVALMDSRSLGMARFLMRKVRQPLSTILRSDSLNAELR